MWKASEIRPSREGKAYRGSSYWCKSYGQSPRVGIRRQRHGKKKKPLWQTLGQKHRSVLSAWQSYWGDKHGANMLGKGLGSKALRVVRPVGISLGGKPLGPYQAPPAQEVA